MAARQKICRLNKHQSHTCSLCKRNFTWKNILCGECAGVSSISTSISKEIGESSNKVENTFEVLLIEDSALIQFVLKKMLIKMNCHVAIATNGQEALSMSKNIPDLVLLDVGLPDMPGCEVANKLVVENKLNNVPIVVITAYSLDGIKEKNWPDSVIHFLNKPVGFESLWKIIKELKKVENQQISF